MIRASIKTENLRSKEPRNILSCFSEIISTVNGLTEGEDKDNLTFNTILPKVRKQVEYVGKLLDFTQVQVVLMAAFMEKSYRYRQDMSDVAEMLHMNYLYIMGFMDDVMDLRKRGYLYVENDGSSIRIPSAVQEAINRNCPYAPPSVEGLSTIGIMRRLKDLFTRVADHNIKDEELMEEAKLLIGKNPDTAFSKAWKEHCMDALIDAEQQLFLFLAHSFYSEDDDRITRSQIQDNVFEEGKCADRILGSIHTEHLSLMKRGLVEFCNDGNLKSKEFIHIKDEIKEEFFRDACSIANNSGELPADVIEADKIKERELFYDAAVARQVDVLESMLSKERYVSVCEGLKKKALRTGFTCLFYGSPGTGKTETAYQLARRSGRNVLMVDVSSLKSCWVGESEKSVKGLFDRYKKMVKESETVPILLFNEADAIFGIRQEGAQRAVDKMENSLQNIILQQMEDLEGILIATTNLTCNLDKAFERRFLYKIRFERPSVEIKTKIWASMLPELTGEQSAKLAEAYDFSGGQIENISRKKMIQGVIDGVEPDFDALCNFCDEERILSAEESEERRRVGF